MSIIVLEKKTLAELAPVAKDVIIRSKAPTKSQVVAVFDVSGSMDGFYREGVIDALATRVLALGLELDDNGSIPVYALDHGVKKLPDLTKDNLDGYTQKLHKMVGGGTNYAPSLQAILDDAEAGDPMLVLFFTDGENGDHHEAEEVIKNASRLPIFFQFYGIYGNYGSPGFNFLKKLDSMGGRQVDNAGFSELGLEMGNNNGSSESDTELYEDMLKEYKDFPKKCVEADVKWENISEVVKPRRKLFGIF